MFMALLIALHKIAEADSFEKAAGKETKDLLASFCINYLKILETRLNMINKEMRVAVIGKGMLWYREGILT